MAPNEAPTPRKTHCKNGHEYAVVGRYHNGGASWRCAGCLADYRRRNLDRIRAANRERNRLDRDELERVLGVRYKPRPKRPAAG